MGLAALLALQFGGDGGGVRGRLLALGDEGGGLSMADLRMLGASNQGAHCYGARRGATTAGYFSRPYLVTQSPSKLVNCPHQ